MAMFGPRQAVEFITHDDINNTVLLKMIILFFTYTPFFAVAL